mmetsp:Transcript_13480/g.31697  ORF Transcript_13480/g.31697 Transcript_13480/m.31697 type:complete len:362 (+) Transcript_13480:1185-2270(+)
MQGSIFLIHSGVCHLDGLFAVDACPTLAVFVASTVPQDAINVQWCIFDVLAATLARLELPFFLFPLLVALVHILQDLLIPRFEAIINLWSTHLAEVILAYARLPPRLELEKLEHLKVQVSDHPSAVHRCDGVGLANDAEQVKVLGDAAWVEPLVIRIILSLVIPAVVASLDDSFAFWAKHTLLVDVIHGAILLLQLREVVVVEFQSSFATLLAGDQLQTLVYVHTWGEVFDLKAHCSLTEGLELFGRKFVVLILVIGVVIDSGSSHREGVKRHTAANALEPFREDILTVSTTRNAVVNRKSHNHLKGRGAPKVAVLCDRVLGLPSSHEGVPGVRPSHIALLRGHFHLCDDLTAASLSVLPI